MNAWFALTKKEFRLGLPAFLFAVILYGGFLGLVYWMGSKIGFQDEIMMSGMIAVLIFHIPFIIRFITKVF